MRFRVSMDGCFVPPSQRLQMEDRILMRAQTGEIVDLSVDYIAMVGNIPESILAFFEPNVRALLVSFHHFHLAERKICHLLAVFNGFLIPLFSVALIVEPQLIASAYAVFASAVFKDRVVLLVILDCFLEIDVGAETVMITPAQIIVGELIFLLCRLAIPLKRFFIAFLSE